MLSLVSIPCVIFIKFTISLIKPVNCAFFLYRWKPPGTLWGTQELPSKQNKTKKKKERLACNLWKEGVQMLFMTLNLTISLFISFCLFIYLFIFWLKKAIIYSHVNKNLKQETIIVFVNFVKFANCDNWIFSPESPVEKYVHFQAFTSVSFAKTFICRIMSQKKTMDNKIDCKSNSANSSQIQ